jgi:uncharacterized protein (TIGR00730 family)
MNQIAVYCSSSDTLNAHYYDVAQEFGEMLGSRRMTLVYGGGDVGLMGVLARAVHTFGGRVVGVIPDRLREIEGRAYTIADELIVTDSMSERKSIIWRRADAFVTLAGGVGTLEEFLEVITLKKLGYHDKPVALINTTGLFDALLEQFDAFDAGSFSSEPTRRLFDVVSEPGEIATLTAFRPFF